MSKYDAVLGAALLSADPFAQEQLTALRRQVVQRRNPERNAERKFLRSTQAERTGVRVEKNTGQYPKFPVERKHKAAVSHGVTFVGNKPGIVELPNGHRVLGMQRREWRAGAPVHVSSQAPPDIRERQASIEAANRDALRNGGMTKILFLLQRGIDLAPAAPITPNAAQRRASRVLAELAGA